MLKKRVEVLFDEGEYRRLDQIARTRKQSVGSLVREAVEKYVVQPDKERKRKALEWFLANHEGPVGSPEEIKADIIASITEGIEKSLETD